MESKDNLYYVVTGTGLTIGAIVGLIAGFNGAGAGGAILSAMVGGFVGCFIGGIIAMLLVGIWSGWERLVEERFMPILGTGAVI